MEFKIGETVRVTSGEWFEKGELVDIKSVHRGSLPGKPYFYYHCENKHGHLYYIHEKDLESLHRHDAPLRLIEDLLEAKDREIRELREQLDSIRKIIEK
jgi:hypothetical protein